MIFNDGVPVDQYGLFLTCPKCGNTEFRKRAQQCDKCGTSRRNVCMTENKRLQPHINAVNARYCEACGAETILFHYGALKPWQDALDLLRKEARPVLSEPAELPF